MEQKVAALRAELEALEREHKERTKDTKVTPEEHFESTLRISNLRGSLRELERMK